MKKNIDSERNIPSGRVFFYGYIIVIAGFCIWLVSGGMLSSFGVFYKPLIDEFHWTRAETVLSFSLVAIVQAIMAIVMGWLTDRLGPRIVITVFGSFLGISYLLMSSMSSLWQFYLYYVLFAGIGFSTSAIPVMATIARWFNRKRGLITAIVQAGSGIGGLIFAPFSGYLILSYGWRSAYAVVGGITLITIIVTGLLFRRNPAIGEQSNSQASGNTLRQAENRSPSHGKTISLKRTLKTKQFWIVSGLFFCFGFCRSTFLPHIANHAQDMGFTLTDGANILAALTISSILGRLMLGSRGNKNAFIISFGITAIALIWALVTRSLWGLYLFALIFGIGWGAQAVLRFAITAETFELTSIGLIMGILGFSEAIASSLGSYLAGYLFDITGTYAPAFWIALPVSVGGMLMALFLKPTDEIKLKRVKI